MKVYSLILVLIISLHVNAFSMKNEYQNDEKVNSISFHEYKYFMFYSRDSIMRKILSTHLLDFCLNENCDIINWKPDINLDDDELFDVLTDCFDKTEVNYLLQVEDDYLVVDTDKLKYKSVNIFPEIPFIDLTKPENKLSIYDKWYDELDTLNIYNFLTKEQIENFYDWKSTIGQRKTRKLIKSKKFPKRQSFNYYFEFDWRSELKREIKKNHDGTFYVEEFNEKNQLVYNGNFSSICHEIRQGNFRFFKENGVLYAVGEYHNDSLNGIWSFLNESGDIIKEIDYTKLKKRIKTEYRELDSLLENKMINRIYNLQEIHTSPQFVSKEYENFPTYVHSQFQSLPFIEINNPRKRYPNAKIEFVIDSDGNLRAPKIISGQDLDFNLELLRVLLNSPKWNPAKKYTQFVAVRYVMNIQY